MPRALQRPMPAPAIDPAAQLTAELGLAASSLGSALLALVDALQSGLSVKDATTGRYLHANEAMAGLFDRSAQDLIGRVDADLIDASLWVPLRAADQLAATQAIAKTMVHRLELAGRVREFSVTRLCLPTIDRSAPSVLLSVWIEQSIQRQREQQLQQALHQLEQASKLSEPEPAAPLSEQTDSQLRVQFEDQLRRELDLSNREHREFALVSVAIDPLNDALAQHGELARERIQHAVTRLMRGNTRAMDASCRLDAHRFAILLSGVGLATAHSRIEGLRRQCATEIIAIEGQDLRFTVSMGVASYPHTADDREALLLAADTALAQAQRRGGNHVALASIRFDRR